MQLKWVPKGSWTRNSGTLCIIMCLCAVGIRLVCGVSRILCGVWSAAGAKVRERELEEAKRFGLLDRQGAVELRAEVPSRSHLYTHPVESLINESPTKAQAAAIVQYVVCMSQYDTYHYVS
jgi:hypothetical protein